MQHVIPRFTDAADLFRDKISALFHLKPSPIDVAKLVPVLDRHAAQWTALQLYKTFIKHGCAVVRGLIEPVRLAETKTVIEKAYLRYPGHHVHDAHLRLVTDERMSGWEIADAPLLQAFLRLVFEGQDWRQRELTARRIQGFDSASEDWQAPLGLHLDSQFHDFPFTVNFWIPFDDCGVDAPSLQLIPLNYRATRAYTGFTPKQKRAEDAYHFGHFTKDVLAIGNVTKGLGNRCFFHPVMQPGDVIVSSNWIIHGTYRTEKMRKGRTSAELRYIGTKLNV
jgi:hypothetical protein